MSPPGPGRAGAPPLARPLILLVRGYQVLISPLLPPSCRFHPSCSQYAAEALAVHGAVTGLGLALWRLLRCGPWHPGGIDPVPPRRFRGPGPDPRHHDGHHDVKHHDGHDETGSAPGPVPPSEERTAC